MAKYSSLDDLPDWPGNTPPKNRAGKKPASELSDKFNGARSKVLTESSSLWENWLAPSVVNL
jgi:hypothetical protein